MRGAALALVATAASVAVLSSTTALAAAPPPLWKKGQNCGDLTKIVSGECGFKAFEVPPGLKLVETTIPRGIAADPETGHLYVADQQNQRVVELTAWGDFVKAWGWGVANGASELQSCVAEPGGGENGCLKGLGGAGRGQFKFESAGGVAVDSSGGIYVVDIQNLRFQKFDRDGNFIWMVGGDVNKTKVEEAKPVAEQNLCPVDPGDVCQAGSAGTEPGQFESWPFSSFIATGPGDTVYVGDKGRIQKFSSAGSYLGNFPDPEGLLSGQSVRSLAVDSAGKAYVGLQGGKVIHKLNASGTKACTATFEPGEAVNGQGLQAVAVSPNGGFYVVNDPSPVEGSPNLDPRIIEFDSNCNRLEPTAGFGNKDEGPPGGPGIGPLIATTGIATGSACYSGGQFGLYVTNFTFENSFIRAYGPTPDPNICPPPEVAPTINAQFAASVDDDGAVLKAQINPHFWPDATYYLEYGTAPCFEGGCTKVPTPPGSPLGAAVEADVTTSGIFLTGLSPDTTYHYRFVAESGGGGPVIGKGGTESADGDEASFTTLPEAEAADTACPNQVFRTGPSAALADCRAYEMVSPVDKDGGDIETSLANFVLARINQASLSGERITYSSYRAFADPKAAPFTSQYLAERDPEQGWQSESISAPQEGPEFIGLVQIESLYKAFSPELDFGWNLTNTEPVLGPGGQPGVPNLYRRDSETGNSSACTAAAPTVPVEAAPDPQGGSADHSHMVFRSQGDLTADAAPGNKLELYMCSYPEGGGGASVQLLSILPNGSASTENSQAGSPAMGSPSGIDRGRASLLDGAVSEDGERVFWTAGPGDAPGSLYLRLNATNPATASGECSEAEPEGACTVEVSGAVTTRPARFWGASPDGETALFEVADGPDEGDLYLFETAKAIAGETPTTLVAHESKGVAGFSEDLSEVYLVSEEELGGEGEAGKANLYRYEAGGAPATKLVAELAEIDTASGASVAFFVPSPVNERPDKHTARVTADGETLVFMSSSAELADQTAGYDNTDQVSGEPDAEIYRYEAGSEEVVCISCNRTGARPQGRRFAKATNLFPDLWVASFMRGWENSLDPLHPVSADGSRVFFESFEPLVLTDTNGKADVYEWEEAGAGTCKATQASYIPATGGCLTLISSGKSPADSEFIDASQDGRDAFFTTASSLLPQDPGSIDLYDARAGGGFPPPPAPEPECEGQACQNPPPPPNDPTPASAAVQGAGNVKEPKPKSCRKGTHKVKKNGKVRCVKNKKKASKKGRSR